MLAIVFFDPFWLKVIKGILLSSLSSSIPCFILPCSGPVACNFADDVVVDPACYAIVLAMSSLNFVPS